jgi:hypothetical protein
VDAAVDAGQFGGVDTGPVVGAQREAGRVATPRPAATRDCTTTVSSLCEPMRGVKPGPGGRFQAGQVVAHRRLRTVQLTGRIHRRYQ